MICADCKHNPLDTGYKDMDCKCPCHTAGKRHFHYSIGPIYNLDSNGIVDTVFVGTSLGRREDVFISTSAILDSATGQAAELLFISEPEASVNTMPPPDMLEVIIKNMVAIFLQIKVMELLRFQTVIQFTDFLSPSSQVTITKGEL